MKKVQNQIHPIFQKNGYFAQKLQVDFLWSKLFYCFSLVVMLSSCAKNVYELDASAQQNKATINNATKTALQNQFKVWYNKEGSGIILKNRILPLATLNKHIIILVMIA